MIQVRVPYVDFPAQFQEDREQTLRTLEAVLEKGDFILGNAVSTFEESFAKISGVRHAVAVANGTDALILALKVLGIGPGDEVITAANSWISSAAAIALVGATPVFADVLEDQTLSPKLVEKAITPRTRCILPVHLTGRCANLTSLLEIGKKHGIPIVEDAAQAVTAAIDGMTVGSAGIMGCFSLHPLKNLNAAGDGGIVTTNDPKIYKDLLLWRNHGLVNREEVAHWGYNSRLDTIQASLLNFRMSKLIELIERRRKNAHFYDTHLEGIVQCPRVKKNEAHTYHVYVIQTERRNELSQFLAERGVETRIHYPIPIHLQKAAEYLGYKKGSLPVTEMQADRILSLPVHPYLSEEQLTLVCNSIKEFKQL